MAVRVDPAPSHREELDAARADFLRAHPAFARTAHIDQLRRSDYARLDRDGHIYLDYTGGGLYAASQVREHARLLHDGVFGNPHSINPTSAASTKRMERTRDAVRNYFHAPADQYEVIFTANATGALRLVGEAYPFRAGDHFLLPFDNHNSVNGIREFARRAGARTTTVPLVAPALRLDEGALHCALEALPQHRNGLLALPAQSNFSGVQHDLGWVAAAQAHGWDVLVDAAAFAPTNALDVGTLGPAFVAVSFYKMFGYPTGVGCLITRRDALAKLRRPWFSGGTILAVSIRGDWHRLADGPAAFEDGTVNYLSLPAVEIGLDWLRAVGVDALHTRVETLTTWLLEQLTALEHHNGRPAVRLYGPSTSDRRGGTIALNFLHPDGSIVDERLVDRIARDRNLSLRTGCFCNPGCGEIAFDVTQQALAGLTGRTHLTVDDYIAAIGLPSAGAVRVSLGLPSSFDDAFRFIAFAATFVDRERTHDVLPVRLSC